MKKLLKNAIRKIYYFGFPEAKPRRRIFPCVIGANTRISDDAIISNPSQVKENIVIGSDTHILGNLCVWANAGKIEVGDSTFVGEGTRVYAARHVRIGNRVQIAHNCNIFDNNVHSLDAGNRHKEYVQNTTGDLVQLFSLNEKEVIIDDDAWLGAGVIVLKGVTIGKGAIVGAGSVVTEDVPPYSVAVGNPAKVVKKVDPV